MRLTELEPEFLRIESDRRTFVRVDSIVDADGILFLCPKCYAENSRSRPGVHSVICWRPRVEQEIGPKPGRWEFEGTGYNDLTLRAGSSSILLSGPCNAHFYITNGEIVGCG